jgi:hypothetical protein
MLDYASAQRDAKRYVCAVCWGDLSIIETDEGYRVICPKSNAGECTGSGFVTRRYAQRRKEESKVEKMEVRYIYIHQYKMPEIIGLPRETKSQAQLLSELGF